MDDSISLHNNSLHNTARGRNRYYKRNLALVEIKKISSEFVEANSIEGPRGSIGYNKIVEDETS